MTKRTSIIVKLFVTLLLLLWITKKISWIQVSAVIGSLGWKEWFVAILLVSLQNILAAWRWRLIMQSLSISISGLKSLRYFFVGLWLNQTLPASVGGDIARVWLITRDGQKLGDALHSIILDRLFPLLSLVALIILTLQQWIKLTGQTAPAMIFLILVLAAMAITVVLIQLSEKINNLHRTRWIGKIQEFVISIKSCMRHPRDLLPPLLSGIVGFALMSELVSTLSFNMSINLGFWECLALCPPVFLIASLPVSIAGWGIREGAMVLILGLVKIPPTQAMSLSIAVGLIVLIGSIPGLLCLWHLKFSPTQDANI